VPWDEPGSTALVVMTPEIEAVAGSFYREHSAAGRDGMTPHVTLVVPFVPAAGIHEGIENRLRSLFRRFEGFDYHLRRFEYFESGVLWLAPEPPRPFADLASAIVEEFPEYPPYEGVHEEVIPHVTVAESNDQRVLEQIRSEVEPRLPIRCRAEKATLVVRGSDLRWRPRSPFHFGSLE
jgi:2'-5' RNA ligase superfamily